MKHVSNLLDLSQIREEKEKMSQPSRESAEVINWLFKELRSNFTAFKQAWPDQESYTQAKKTWLKAFVLSGINRIEQLQHGLNKCYLMEKPFVPTPGEFIAWCKPSPQDLGFPSPEEAYVISIKMNIQFSDYRHKDDRVDAVIRHAIGQICPSTYREMKVDNAKKTFKTYYDIALRQFLDGELKIIPKALPEKAEAHPADKPRSDEARLRAMEAIRSMGINVKRTDDRGLQENPV